MKTLPKVLIGLGALVVAGVGGFVWFLGHAKGVLEPRVSALMTDLSAGRYDAAYDACAPALQEKFSRGRFAAMFEEIVAPLGAFKDTGDASGVSMATATGKGTTGSIQVELIFERATVPASFDLVKLDDVWRFESIELQELERVMPPADPSGLVPAGTALIEAFNAGDDARVHGMLMGSLRDEIRPEKVKEVLGGVRTWCPTVEGFVLKSAEDVEGAKLLTWEGRCPSGARVISTQQWRWRNIGWRVEHFRMKTADQ